MDKPNRNHNSSRKGGHVFITDERKGLKLQI